jgi:hypothetical protein
MLMAMAGSLLALALTAAVPADVKGKWDGKVTSQRDDGSTSEDAALLILDQKDTTVTGSVGGSETDQHPITSGTLEGNRLKLTAKNTGNGREYSIELTLEGDELKGTVTSGARKGQVHAKRRKD